MKIVILTLEFPEGIKTNNYSLIENCNFLSNQGHEIYLLGPKSNKSDIKESFNFLKVGFFSHKNPNRKFRILKLTIDYLMGAIFKIYRISPDLIICNGVGGFLYLKSIFGIIISKIMKIPIIQVWIGTDLLSRMTKLNKLLKKIVLLRSTINVVQSVHMQEVVSSLTNKSKVVVIPNKGVNRTKFYKATNRVNNKEIKLLYIGRNELVKGTKYLIDAFIQVQKKYPETFLDIVGIGPDEEAQFKQIKEFNLSKKIKFNGSVPYEKIVDFYHNSDIFILPSLMEGLSNAIMEAMACGLPIVATDVGGNKELIISEKGGHLVQPKNSVELSNAILDLVENPKLRKEMGIFNLTVIKQFDSKLIMKKKEKLIKYLFNFFKN